MGLPSREVLDAANEGWIEETMPMADLPTVELEKFIDEDLGGFVKLACASMSPEARKEFVEQALVEFANIPFSLLVPAIAMARRTVSFPNRLVPFVVEHTAEKLAKLEAEGEILGELLRLSDG